MTEREKQELDEVLNLLSVLRKATHLKHYEQDPYFKAIQGIVERLVSK